MQNRIAIGIKCSVATVGQVIFVGKKYLDINAEYLLQRSKMYITYKWMKSYLLL